MTDGNPYRPPIVETSSAADGAANTALALAIVSLVLCAPITAPIALWKARAATGTKLGGRVLAAKALAWVGIGTSVVLWFVVVWSFFSDVPRK